MIEPFSQSHGIKKVITVTLALFLSIGLVACGGDDGGPTASGELDVSGVWDGTGTDESGPGELTFTLRQEGDQVSGSFEAVDAATGLQADGTIEGEIDSSDEFTGRMEGSFPAVGCTLDLFFEATVQGNTMTGIYAGQGCQQQLNDGEFSLSRQ